jgi:hypothetical protein
MMVWHSHYESTRIKIHVHKGALFSIDCDK